MAASDTRQLQLQISASAELLIRNLKTADTAVADFQRQTNSRLSSIDARFAAVGALKGKLSDLDNHVGLGGLATAATGATLIELARRGLEYASSLQEVSQQLGVTSKDLQTYRYAASQVGIEQDTIEKGLAKLTLTMGKAETGADGPTKAFAALGISIQSLKGSTAGDVIPRIADGLAKIEDPAQRAALEVELFGKAGQQLDTLLSGGRGTIDDLAAAAQRLGLVLSAKEIADADATADKLSEVRQVLEADIARTVAQNAEAILGLANAIETLIGKLGSFNPAYSGFLRILAKDGVKAAARSFFDVGNKAGADQTLASTPQGYVKLKTNQYREAVYQYRAAKADPASDRGRVTELAQSVIDTYSAAKGAVRDFQKDAARGLAATANERLALLPPGGGNSTRNLASPPAKGPAGKTAEQLAREAAAAAKKDRADQRKSNDTLSRAELDSASARADRSGDPDERLKIEQDRVDLARQGRDDDLDLLALDNRYVAANLDRLKSLNRDTAEIDKQILAQKRAQEVDQAAFDRVRASEDDQVALLDIQSQLAIVAKDRHAIEQRILALKQQEEREALQRVVADKNNRFTPAEKTLAQDQLGRLSEKQDAEQKALAKNQQGPIAAYRDQLIAATGDMNEALQGVAVHGLQSLEDGLLGVIDGTESVGDAFKKMASSIVADLARIAIEKLIVNAIGSSFLGFAGGGIVPGYAEGGVIRGAGTGTSDSILARVSAGEGILTADALQHYGHGIVGAINSKRLPAFAAGGVVASRLPSVAGAGGAASDGLVHVAISLTDDLNARIDSRATGVSVAVVRESAPTIIQAATSNTMSELRRPSI